MPSNLPPGCTTSGIDRSAGYYKVECTSCSCLCEACDTDEDGQCPECSSNNNQPTE